MPLSPTTAIETQSRVRDAQWCARSWIFLILTIFIAGFFTPFQNLNWTIAKSLIIVLIALAHGIIVLLFVARARTAVTLHARARAHGMLVCPKDYTPVEVPDNSDICACPTCNLEIEQSTLREFWTDTLASDQYWKHWLVSRKSALAELPYTDPEQRTAPDSDTVAAKLARARLLNWIVLVLAIILVSIFVIQLSTNTPPRGFMRLMFFAYLLVWAVSFFSSLAADRAKAALRRHTRQYHALVCPKDFYPLVESDPDYEALLCPECGMTTTKTECRSFWQATLAGKYRWAIWLLFARPRITQLPSSDAD